MPVFCRECNKVVDGSVRQESYTTCDECKKNGKKKK